MTAPAHAAEHHDLLQVVGKIANQSELIAVTILITIGADGRPCVGGNVDDPSVIMSVLRQLIAAEDQVDHDSARRIGIPRDN